MKTKTLLFLDIDGVLSVMNPNDPAERHGERGWAGSPSVWPIPMAKALLDKIEYDARLQPIWLSAWGDRSVLWNLYSYTSLWPRGYHLLPGEWRHARRIFKQLAGTERRPTWDGVEIDAKLAAVRYHARWHDGPICWVEDGFATETLAWAAHDPRAITLVDTNQPDLITELLTSASPDGMLDRFMGGKKHG